MAGGVPGFLLGFTAVLVAVDRPLAYLADDTGWAATVQRRRRGTETIAIASIVGTSDRHKAESFDREFRPPPWSRGRWIELYLAAQRGAALPPVAVYRVDNRHFVRDGHHRVSVARAIGATAIEASVVELVSTRPEGRLRRASGAAS